MTHRAPSDAIRQLLDEGKHVLVRGHTPPDALSSPAVVRTSADENHTLGVLEVARLAVGRALGERESTHRRDDLRMRIIGEHWGPTTDLSFLDACNRLRQGIDGSALLIDDADAMDPDSADALATILQRGELELPLALCASGPMPAPLETAFDALVEAGRAGVIEAGSDTDTVRLEEIAWRDRRILRAAAVLGREIFAPELAKLLETSTLEVVEAMQRAADAGAPIADRGDAHFGLPQAWVEAIRAQTLPSLRQLWHRRLAAVLAPRAAAVPAPTIHFEPAPPTDPEVFEPAPDAAEISIAGSDHIDLERAAPPSDQARRNAPREREPSHRRSRPDRARAAAHFDAAGDHHAAAEAMLEASLQALASGDAKRAQRLAAVAGEQASALPPSEARDRLIARSRLREGEVLWYGAAAGGNFTLDAALEKLAEAAELLPANASHERAQLAHAIAGVCFERGDLRSLERALVELVDTSHALLEAGEARAAARLMNDQAAVYLRAGDPVRAVHLLRKSRQVFEEIVRDDPADRIAGRALAETEHLHARLPLHARVRPGRERDAYDMALGHAQAAESLYRQLDDATELARVWETMGRLEIARGETTAALDRLMRALRAQRRHGDLLGLARTTAALADVLRSAGRSVDALAVLSDSVASNIEKGSPLGLAYNQRALRTLAPDLPASVDEQLEALRETMARAAARFGRVSLPPLA